MSRIYQYPSKFFNQHQGGLSLVEILVALTISLFLIAGVIQLFIGSKQTYRFNESLSRLQENGRFAIDRMAQDIRMAGYRTDLWSPPLSNAIEVVPGDEDNDGEVTVRFSNEAGTVTLSRRYFINTGSGGMPGLFLHDGVASPQEFVEGVERMQIETIPCAGGSSSQVCGVRINLLLVSIESNVATEPQTVIFPPGTTNSIAIPNRRIPQIFSTTVAIRNRPF